MVFLKGYLFYIKSKCMCPHPGCDLRNTYKICKFIRWRYVGVGMGVVVDVGEGDG